MNAPTFNIDLASFKDNPYPELAQMRQSAPICYVPQLDATLITLRDDIFKCEKMIDVFSSDQPGGLMTVLMGQNMMRKDGDEHQKERRQILPSVSPKTVKNVWHAKFVQTTNDVLDQLETKQQIDLVKDFAMPVSAHALRHITGLENMTTEELDSSSQGMIDGIANYTGDPVIQERCESATGLIDTRIDQMLSPDSTLSPHSLLGVLTNTDQPMESVRANIKLAISGGQNEPRDAIAGTVWALLTHPDQLSRVLYGELTWHQAFEEYARWISPIGMSPRRIAKPFTYKEIHFEPESRAFLMFGSANRDEHIFDNPDQFNIERNTSKSVSFGAGPHFCAGAAASRNLISEVALPRLFARFPNIKLNGDVPFGGWAFRGPLTMPVQLR